MAKRKNKLIAFDDLERMIIEPGFCTLCGACEAACPVHAIKVEHERPQRLHDCSEHIDTCPICYDICPHTDALLFDTLKFVADAPHRREALGYYRKIMLARATNPTLRDASMSGGVVTALLNFAIAEKIIDGAIASEASSKVPIKVKPSIHHVPDDTLSAVDAKIVPSAVAEAFGRAVFEHGKANLAFVGIPCHVVALRKLEAWQHKLMDSLQITIGLFCLWTFSLGRLLEYLLNEHNVAANEIRSFDLTANDYVITTEEGVIRIPLSEAKSHVMNSCRTCPYFTSELADLSIGGAGPLKDWSVVIIRTKKGEDFFKMAVNHGVISTKKIESEALAHVLQLATYKRDCALQEIEAMRKQGIPVPVATEIYSIPSGNQISRLESMKVKEIMTRRVTAVSPTDTVHDLLDKIAKHHHVGFPVIDVSNKVCGIVTLQDAMNVDEEKRDAVIVGDIAARSLVMVFPDSSVDEAIRKMSEHGVGRLLVVDENDVYSLLGILTRSDVMHAMNKVQY
jgi:coenzyme F420 hydrogenase subunit beta